MKIPFPLARAAFAATPLVSVLAASLSAAGCGDNNPYKSHTTKCKVDCVGTSDAVGAKVPRTTNAVVLSMAGWDDINRSKVSDEALAIILKRNPFALAQSSFLAAKETIDGALAARNEGTSNIGKASATCRVGRLSAPSKRVRDHVQVWADYGKCVPLDALSQSYNKNKPQGDENLYKASEYESAFTMLFPAAAALKPAAAGVVAPQSAVEWANAFPFRAIVPADVALVGEGTPEQQYADLSFQFASAQLSTRETWKDQKVASALRSRSARGMAFSTDEAKLVRARFDADGKGLSFLHGSLFHVQDVVANPSSSNPVKGEQAQGLTTEYDLKGMRFVRPASLVSFGPSLGFTCDAVIPVEAFYTVYVNVSLDPSISSPAYPDAAAFVMKGRGVARYMDVEMVKGGTSVPMGAIDLCATE